MELDKISKLLAKYDEGETSLQEEQEIANYLKSQEVLPQHQMYKLLFKFSEESKEKKLKTTIELPKKSKLKPHSWWYAAAMVVLVVSIYIFSNNSPQKPEVAQLTQEEVTYQQTKQALQMISHYMNEGRKDLKYLKEFNKATNQIIKTK
ncbi:hypothetical protein [Zunongwangia sp.]|uniref:hypothetical protein n=1 Tax=Zunongwangia sp. TaxID=1965325 RepID=UPI003AA9CA67